MVSPYFNRPIWEWQKITQDLICQHPLEEKEIKDFVLEAWDDIFNSSIGRYNLKIGKEIFPKPQIIGALLHELIPAVIISSYPSQWKRETEKNEKDIVYLPDDLFSIELKTSSNPKQIFGNRSYAQKVSENKKIKDGYYLTVNFENITRENVKPAISLVRFGWIDHFDWIGQTSATGQQARLSPEVYNSKLKILYTKFK